MLISPTLVLFSEPYKNMTQNDVNFKFLLFHSKSATVENTDQAAHVH